MGMTMISSNSSTAPAIIPTSAAGALTLLGRKDRRQVNFQIQSLRRSFLLCRQQTFVVSELLRYSSLDVLDPLWAAMEASIKRAPTVDVLVDTHRKFLIRARRGLLLADLNLVEAMAAVQESIEKFCCHIDSQWNALSQNRTGLVSFSTKTGAPPSVPNLPASSSNPSTPYSLASHQIIAMGAATSAQLFAEFESIFSKFVGLLQERYISLLKLNPTKVEEYRRKGGRGGDSGQMEVDEDSGEGRHNDYHNVNSHNMVKDEIDEAAINGMEGEEVQGVEISNEIQALQNLIERLNFQGATVTKGGNAILQEALAEASRLDYAVPVRGAGLK